MDLPRQGPARRGVPPLNRRWTRLAWFVALWAASVAVLGAVAMVIRAALGL
ncbi:MAG TPA: DUF2474 family protein [Falsiroseomonas sp.]|nr:DUF2474 family protein [Falsiroseomonas sp.]